MTQPSLVLVENAVQIAFTVNDQMQKDYRYQLVAPTGRSFNLDFDPDLTPKEMLRLGVFGGKYMTDCQREYPRIAGETFTATIRSITQLFRSGREPVPCRMETKGMDIP